MPEGPDGTTIIIVKKVSGHGGHHGGAWKVAYADFVTAMMALFMVLWLVNSASVTTREKIASYFKRPGVFEMGSGTPLETGGQGILPDAFAPPVDGNAVQAPGHNNYNIANTAGEQNEGFGKGEGESEGDIGKAEQPEGLTLNLIASDIKDNIEKTLSEDGGIGQDYYGQGMGDVNAVSQELPAQSDIQDDASKKMSDAEAIKQEFQNMSKQSGVDNPLGEIDVVIDQRGIHIEIMDTEKTSMFEVGSAVIKGEAGSALEKISQLLVKLPNPVDIEGHTDALPFSSAMRNRYDNWNLSMDRANSARRALESAGLAEDRIARVVGYAAQKPKLDDPLDPSNRRITITMRYSAEAASVLSGKASVTNPLPSKNFESNSFDSADTTVVEGKGENKLEVEVGTHLPEGEKIDPEKFRAPSTVKDKIFGGNGTLFDMLN